MKLEITLVNVPVHLVYSKEILTTVVVNQLTVLKMTTVLKTNIVTDYLTNVWMCVGLVFVEMELCVQQMIAYQNVSVLPDTDLILLQKSDALS